MHIKLKNELILINILSAILIFVIYVPDIQALRIALGLPFILFFPGYTLIAALFPKKTDLDPIERVALSFGLSIAVVPLIGLALNYVWSIRLTPILTSLTIFIAAMSAIAWYRRRGITEEEKLNIAVNISLPKGENTTKLDKALSVILVIAIIGAIGTLGYVIAKPKVGERFTEFYILGPNGKAEGYPTKLAVGEEGEVILGIINQEHKRMGYEVEMSIGGKVNQRIGPIELPQKDRWEKMVSFTPKETSAATKLTEDVYQPYGPYPGNQSVILVASVEHLQPGDYLSIGTETAQVQKITGNQLTLTEPLKNYHPAGEAIIEHQRVGFMLYKIREFDGDTQLALHLGTEALSAIVTNRGQSEAGYDIRVGSQESGVKSSKSDVLSQGQEWKQEIQFSSPVGSSDKIEFSLYREGKLLYNEESSGSYPALHLWIDVK